MNSGSRSRRTSRSPIDANQDNAYKVTIIATDKQDLTGMRGP